ncbi:MAG TPA: GAF domain-containing SpoIIE family protein phosphatase [Acidimicrobiales bacterium]|nr:GAF domain-containing SpoIIE family protein phosphatase [Acidimicrobiales bacterium]
MAGQVTAGPGWGLDLAAGDTLAAPVLEAVPSGLAVDPVPSGAVPDPADETGALRFLLEATTVLSSSLDFEECLRRLAALAVPMLGDLCLIDLLSDGTIVRMAAAHRDPAQMELVDELSRNYPPHRDGEHPAAKAIRTGRSEISSQVSDEFLRRTTRDQRHFEVVKQLGFASYMCAPLRARGRILGSITLVSSGSGRRFDRRDLALAEDLAYRAALVIDNARLFSERTEVARSLQSALLPPRLPAIEGLEVAARYRAAGEGLEVGGDFYDLFSIGRGAWAAVIGDVCGRGSEAAAVTGLVRHSLHASALQARNPASMLQVANAVLGEHQDGGSDRFCTAACAILRPGEVTRATIASAGHPAPLILRADGAIEEFDGGGLALGIAPGRGPGLHSKRYSLGAGDTLVLYTDGVTEARDGSGRFFGHEGLEAVLRERAGSGAGPIAGGLLHSVEAFSGGRLNDDLAILVISVPS